MLTDATGLPLVVRTGRANENDHLRLLDLLAWLPPVPGRSGRPRRVREVMADGAYGVAWLVAAVVALGYRSLLKPRGKAGERHGSGLGRRRYVVERTMAWFGDFRRLKVCHERTWRSWQGYHELAACLICARRLDALRQQTHRK